MRWQGWWGGLPLVILVVWSCGSHGQIESVFSTTPVPNGEEREGVSSAGFRYTAFWYTATGRMEEGDITWVTQLSVDRLGALLHALRTWQGPMSAAVLIRKKDDVALLRKALMSEPLFRRFLNFHLVFDKGTPYPVNPLRNVALDHALTSRIFLVDADFVPSDSMLAFREFMEHEETRHGNKTVFVVPAFSSSLNPYDLPRNKNDLLQNIIEKKVEPVNSCVCVTCHGPTNYERWYRARESYTIPYEWMYEPYILGPRAILRYDERFVGYANDKTSHTFALALTGHVFVVLSDVFVTHLAHEHATWYKEEHGQAGQAYARGRIHQTACQYLMDLHKKFHTEESDHTIGMLELPSQHPCWHGRCAQDITLKVAIENIYMYVFASTTMSFAQVRLLIERNVAKFEYALWRDNAQRWRLLTTQAEFSHAVREAAPSREIVVYLHNADPPLKRSSGFALYLDGDCEHIEISRGIFPHIKNQITLEAWVFPTGFKSREFGVETLFSCGWAFAVFLQCWGSVEMLVGPGHMVPSCQEVIPMRKWTHVAVVMEVKQQKKEQDNSIMRLYVNGQLKKEELFSWIFPVKKNSPALTFGSDGRERARCFVGIVDEIRVWSVARTSDDIRGDMRKSLRGDEMGLLAYHKLDDPRLDTARDYTKWNSKWHKATLVTGLNDRLPRWTHFTAPVS